MREFAKGLYNSSSWHKVRQLVIINAHGLCAACNEPGNIVHHITHLNQDNINDDNITLGLDNLTLLCLDCHNIVHGIKEKIELEYYFDEDGNVCKKFTE